ncbi:transposase [Ktedonobacter sp. SOSP1-85]|nr:transposase [Ktedonobacter sp. SOSP1-85]
MQGAFKAFFRRVKEGKTPGYPRFQSRNRYDSFTYPQAGFSLENGCLALSKIGHVKIKLHRKVLGTIKTCSIKREEHCWYACLACEVEAMPRTPYTDEAVGIDLGVSKLATLSTGDVIENPKHYRRVEKKLAKAQQALARKKRGSKRRKKAVQRVAKLHRKVRNQRNDYLHQWSRRLVNTYETIVFEDIAPANLSRRAKPKQDEETGKSLPNGASAKSGLNKSILDAGWSQFIAFCQYKAENAGTVQGVKVDPRMTSQVCSGCGTVRKKTLSERWHSCECGCDLDRDHNAARNIKALWLGRSLQEVQAS